MSRKTTNQEWLCLVKERMLKCNSVTSPNRRFILPPLIHTIPLENSLQDVGGWSQRANCELKYVMLIFRRTAQTLDKDPSGKIVRSCLSVTLPVVRREARMPREHYLFQ